MEMTQRTTDAIKPLVNRQPVPEIPVSAPVWISLPIVAGLLYWRQRYQA
jgi:hypothetical protein